MANAFNQRPMILDTAWTSGTMPAALTALTSPQEFRRIVWVNPTTPATDECKITDLGGNVLFDEFCSVAHQDVVLYQSEKPYKFKQNKWILATLAAGSKVYLYP